MKIRYHKSALKLLQLTPISSAAAAALAAREQALGVTFPASVREWYSIEGAVEILAEHSNEDFPVPLDELGDAGEAAHGLLKIMDENQGVVTWYVALDGSDDPPVDVLGYPASDEEEEASRDEDEAEDPDEVYAPWNCGGWVREADHFSDFVYRRLLRYGGNAETRPAAVLLKQDGAHVEFEADGAIALVSFQDRPATDAAFDALAMLGEVPELWVWRGEIGPPNWAKLGRQGRLGLLSVAGQHFDDRCLGALIAVSGLASLELIRTAVTDVGLAHFLSLASLKSISLSTPLTDEGYRALALQPGLEAVRLTGSGLTDAGLEGVARLAALRLLHLPNTAITDGGLVHLGGLTALETLCLVLARVEGPGLRHLAGLPSLRELSLISTPLTDQAAPHFARMAALQVLNLSGTRITDELLTTLRDLPRLTELDLRDTTVTKPAVERLQAVKPDLRIKR